MLLLLISDACYVRERSGGSWTWFFHSFITSLFLVRLDSRSPFFPFLPCATGASELAEFEPPFGFQPCLQLEYYFGNTLGPGADVLVLSVSLLQTVQLFSTFI